MLAGHRPGGLVNFLDTGAGKPQRVDEECPDAAAGIELQGRETFGAGDPCAQDCAGDLQHPQRGRIAMAEFVRQVTALDQEGAGTAPHVLAVLCEADFGQFRYGDQVAFFPLVQEMALVPLVEQAVRYIAGYRNGAERPGAQAAVEFAASDEGKVQWKVGSGDDFLPELPPPVRGNVGGRVSGLACHALRFRSKQDRCNCRAALSVVEPLRAARWCRCGMGGGSPCRLPPNPVRESRR